MKTFHRACEIIFQIAIVNFLLFFVIALIIGGDAVAGKIENGQYYLSNHGQLTEVNFLVFWYSKIHVYSVLVTHPLAMLASFLYWITGGGSTRPKSQAVATRQPTNNIISDSIHNIKSLYWNVADFIEEVFWMILDSWRKPDYELFVRFSKQDCIKELQKASNDDFSKYNLEKPILGYFSGNHFYLQKWNYNPWVRDGGVRPVLSGKFSDTSQGTYIRIWHRFTTIGVFFLTTWFGTVLGLLFSFLVVPFLRIYYVQMNFDTVIKFSALIILPLFYVGTMLASILAGSSWGNAKNIDIIEFVKDVLDYGQSSNQPQGFGWNLKIRRLRE
jgi:hypothetical protein